MSTVLVQSSIGDEVLGFVVLLAMLVVVLWALSWFISTVWSGLGWWWHTLHGRRPSVPRYVRVPLGAEVRARVLANAGYRCQACGDTHNLQVDHIYPVSRGGTNDFDNLQCLCKHCNGLKGARV